MTFIDNHRLETYKSLISISVEALKSLQLLNGGALVALLAYLGHASTKGVSIEGQISGPMTLFVVGLFCSTLGFIGSYLTQLALYNESLHGASRLGCSHTMFLWLTFGTALVSVAMFACGALTGVHTLAGAG